MFKFYPLTKTQIHIKFWNFHRLVSNTNKSLRKKTRTRLNVMNKISHSNKTWSFAMLWILKFFSTFGSGRAKCNICQEVITRKNYGTSAMASHLKVKHDKLPQNQDDQIQPSEKRRKQSAASPSMINQISRNHLDCQKMWRRVIISRLGLRVCRKNAKQNQFQVWKRTSVCSNQQE